MFFSLLWQNGGEPYAEDGSEATFGSDDGVAALTWMRRAGREGLQPRRTSTMDAQYVAFKNGKNSITWDGIWQINDLEAAGHRTTASPRSRRSATSRPSWANSHHFFITAQAADDENKSDASKVFIAWMSEQSGEWAGAGDDPGAQLGAGGAPPYTESPQAALDDEIDDHALPAAGARASADASQAEALEVAVNEASSARPTAEESLTQRQSNATELMKQQPGEVRRLIRWRRTAPPRRSASDVQPTAGPPRRRTPQRRGYALAVPRALPGALLRLRARADRLRPLDQPAPLGLHAARQAVRRAWRTTRDLFDPDSIAFEPFWNVDAGDGDLHGVQRAAAARGAAGGRAGDEPEVPGPQRLPGGVLRAVRARRRGRRRACGGSCWTPTSGWSTTCWGWWGCPTTPPGSARCPEAWVALVGVTVWWTLGFNAVIFLAGLQDIPASCTRRPTVDGASGWQRFRHVTLPGLAGAVVRADDHDHRLGQHVRAVVHHDRGAARAGDPDGDLPHRRDRPAELPDGAGGGGELRADPVPDAARSSSSGCSANAERAGRREGRA